MFLFSAFPVTPLPKDDWLTVHPPTPSPYMWPQPGACQLLPPPPPSPPVWLWPPPWTLLLPVPPLQARPILTWLPSCPGPQPPGKEGPLVNSRGLCPICPHPSSVGSCHRGWLRCRCVWGMAAPATFHPPRSCLVSQWPCAPQLWLFPVLVSCQPSSRGLVHCLPSWKRLPMCTAGHHRQSHACPPPGLTSCPDSRVLWPHCPLALLVQTGLRKCFLPPL